jgi:tetratricopeptide (TPR) repeat protein
MAGHLRRLLCVTGVLALCLTAVQPLRGAPRPGQDEIAALSQALAAAEDRLGTAHPDLLVILGPLAQLRFRDAEMTEATALRRRSLRIAVDAFGSDSAPAAKAMTALAAMHLELHHYLDAEPLLIIARNVLISRLGAEDPALAPVLSDLGRIALARGDSSAARNWVEQGIVIDDKNRSEDRSERLRTLGAVLAVEGRFDESARVLNRALALDRGDADEFATARTLSQLANTHLRARRFADALPLIEEATALDQGWLGANHPLIGDDLYTLGLVYLESKRAADAKKALRAAINLLNRGGGRDTPRAGYIQLALARAAHEAGREEEASALFAEARRILHAAAREDREREREV